MLQPLGISFIVSLFASLIIAVTLTPVLCSFWLKNNEMLLKQADGSWLENFLGKHYRSTLMKVMKVKKLVVGLAIVLFIAVAFLMVGLGRSFLPQFNEGTLTIADRKSVV